MLGAGVGQGSLVIVPALTYVATANAATYCGAQVAVADVRPDTWCIDQTSVQQILKRWVSARLSARKHSVMRAFVVPVDLYDALAPLLFEGDNYAAILDASHFMRAMPLESSVSAVTYSFFPSKIITTGEGGAVVTNAEEVRGMATLYSGQGASLPGHYLHSVVGYNYRMTEMAAAIGSAQMRKIQFLLASRAALVARYRFNLLAYPQVTLQGGTRANGWAVAVTTPFDAGKVREKLDKRGIETRRFFTPINKLPMYDHLRQDTPIADHLFYRGLVLPTHTLMSDEDVDRVCEVLIATLKEMT